MELFATKHGYPKNRGLGGVRPKKHYIGGNSLSSYGIQPLLILKTSNDPAPEKR